MVLNTFLKLGKNPKRCTGFPSLSWERMMRIKRLTLLTRQPRRVVFDVQAVQSDEGTEFMVEFEYSWGNFAQV